MSADFLPEIDLATHLVADATIIKGAEPLIICNIYIPSGVGFAKEILTHVNQLPRPYLPLGDFSANNSIWGPSLQDIGHRGQKYVTFLEDCDAATLPNNGPFTHFSPGSNSISAIVDWLLLKHCRRQIGP